MPYHKESMFQHISHLLYYHDRLIVPGLGVFAGNTAGSGVAEGGARLSPPSKKITFSTETQNNDGLLAGYLSEKEGISYAEASRKILEFSESVKYRLNRGEQVVFPRIGTLYSDSNNEIAFEPDTSANYLSESFGLPPVPYVPPVKHAPSEEPRTPPVTTAGPLREAEPVAARVSNWKAIVAVPVVIALGWATFEVFTVRDPNGSYTFHNPFGAQPRVMPVKEQVSAAPAAEMPPLPKAVLEGVTPEDSRYFIVAGCFSDFANASEKLNELQARGYDARLIGTRKGLHVVSYQGFSSRKEASTALQVIQSAENPSAWVLEKR
jgi:nucleoid DNA-binding protein/cell division septation protein DedD